jgi:Predicted membrane protein (DUF2157)
MDKTQILALVGQKIHEGLISKEDIKELLKSSDEEKGVASHAKNITNIFYIIGAIIAVIGVIILLGQNWTEIGFVGRVLSTLGVSVIAYVIGFVLIGNTHRVLSQTFFTITGILAPIGVFVFCSEFRVVFSTLPQVYTALSLLVLFSIAFWYTKRNILMLWNALWITWIYYALLSYFFSPSMDVTKLATMILGITYLCATYYFQQNMPVVENIECKEKHAVENILYTVGILLTILSSLFLGGIFDLITLLLIFGAFYLSIFIKSRFTLVVSGVLLISYILKITSKYFVDSIGWSLSLIAIGFFVIAIGYGMVYVSRTYIPKTKI